MSQTTIIITRAASRSLAERLWHQTVGGLQSFAVDAVLAQRLSRERDQLADLSDSALKDIGLTRDDLRAELRKPLWQR